MMGDFHALNYIQNTIYREIKQRDEQSNINTLLAKIKQQNQLQLTNTVEDEQTKQQNLTHILKENQIDTTKISTTKNNNTTKTTQKRKQQKKPKNQLIA